MTLQFRDSELKGPCFLHWMAAAAGPRTARALRARATPKTEDPMDAKIHRRPNMLSLPGIKFSDWVSPEVAAEDKFMQLGQDETVAAPVEHELLLEKIPAVFAGLNDWPDRTDLRCHACTLSFADRPKFIPTYIREATGGGGPQFVEMGVQGNFCSFACAELWIETRTAAGTEKRWRLQDNLRLAYHFFTGRHIAQIRAALPYTDLQTYGGDLDLTAWLRRNRELEPETSPLPAPLPLPPSVSQPKGPPLGFRVDNVRHPELLINANELLDEPPETAIGPLNDPLDASLDELLNGSLDGSLDDSLSGLLDELLA
jgi:hypothetical protein